MNKTKKMVCFDMDGTIVDLYGVEGWHEMLRAEDPTPYIIAKPLCDMKKLRVVLLKLIAQDWEIRIVTWLSKKSSEDYKRQVRKAKKGWLEDEQFPADKCHMIQYGTTKADTVRREAEIAILVDDNEKVRNGWNLGDTIDPTTQDIIIELEKLLV